MSCFKHALRGSSLRERLLVLILWCAVLWHMYRSFYLAQNYAQIFSSRHHLFRKKNSFELYLLFLKYLCSAQDKIFSISLTLLYGIFIFLCSLVRLYRQRNISPLLLTLCHVELDFKRRIIVLDVSFWNWGISLGEYVENSLYLARKYARIFVRVRCLFQDANSFLRAKLEENYQLQWPDNV